MGALQKGEDCDTKQRFPIINRGERIYGEVSSSLINRRMPLFNSERGIFAFKKRVIT
jgi:hypothetical protein